MKASGKIDTTVAHPARRYNYWLGGKDNYAVDRASADAIEAEYPAARTAAQINRAWMHHVVQRLAKTGIDQFIDIGVGLPVEPNVHEVAQQIIPSARVLYADNDPVVMVHARALFTSTDDGATEYVETDLRDPAAILTEARKLLDFTKPIAVLVLAVLHFIADDEHPDQALAALMDAVPSGSYLALSHGTGDFTSSERNAAIKALPAKTHGPLVSRTREQIALFFTGLDLVSPGLVPTVDLLSLDEIGFAANAEDCLAYAGLAVKP